MKKIILSTVLTMMACLVMAQGFGPQAGDKSLSLQLGRAESFGDLQFLAKNQDSYTIYVPSNSSASTSSNSLVNMIGVEGKYFLSNNLAIRISGMGRISSTPAQQDVPGVLNPKYYEQNTYTNDGGSYTTSSSQDVDAASALPRYTIPGYEDVPSTSIMNFVANLGVDHYYNVGTDRLFPYTGVQANFNYGQRKDYTLLADDLGERVTETYGIGGSLVGGVDYYVAQGFFLGIEIKAVSYMYSVNRIFPQPGMEGGDADNHTTTLFSNPMVKIGFKF